MRTGFRGAGRCAVSFAEGGAAVVLDANVTVSDADLSAVRQLQRRHTDFGAQTVAPLRKTCSRPQARSGALTQGGNLVVGATTNRYRHHQQQRHAWS